MVSVTMAGRLLRRLQELAANLLAARQSAINFEI
jgi:hypothetical protein